GVPTYILMPRDPADLDLLVQSLESAEDANAVDIAIGMRGPLAPTEMCSGLMVPIVAFDQVYSFDRPSLLDELSKWFDERKKSKDPEIRNEIKDISDADFRKAAGEMFDRIMTMADNAGAAEEHRALNYLSVRYHEIYVRAAIANLQGKFLASQEVRPS